MQGLQQRQATCKSSCKQQEKQNSFIEGRKEVGGTIVNIESMILTGQVVAREEDESFFFRLGSVIIAGHEGSPFWSPNSVFLNIFIGV